MNSVQVSPRAKVRVISTDDQILQSLSHCLEPAFKLEWVRSEAWPNEREHADVEVVIHTDRATARTGDIVLVAEPVLDSDWYECKWPCEDSSTLVALVRSCAGQNRVDVAPDWNMDQAVLRVLQTDQQAGRAIQTRMLPSDSLRADRVQVELGFFPSLLLSGDFADYFCVDRESRVMFLLADVAGHGVSSAMVTVVIKNLINRLRRNLERGSSFDLLSPSRVLERINNELQFTALGKHATVFCGLLDTEQRALTYSVAGHTPLPVLVQNGIGQVLQGKGRPVGLFDQVDYAETVISIAPGAFHLCLSSDGVLDLLPGSNSREQTEALNERVSQCDGTLSDLVNRLGWNSQQTLPDDVTLLVVAGQE